MRIIEFPANVLDGGAREMATRQMIMAGNHWLESNPGIVPAFQLENFVMTPTNQAGKDLLAAILAVAPETVDEAMTQTAVNHTSFIRHWTLAGYLQNLSGK